MLKDTQYSTARSQHPDSMVSLPQHIQTPSENRLFEEGQMFSLVVLLYLFILVTETQNS